jgi:two-component system NarL family response regulator
LQAVEQARSLRPDVVLMDVQMPVCSGVEAVRLIKAELPEIKIVMLTVSEAEDDLYQALRNGASGYLLKSLDANRLCQMLVNAVGGATPLPPKLAARMLSETAQNKPRAPTRKSDAPLSDHQWEVLSLVADGLMYKEVGAQLGLSERTVKYHMSQILEHLRLETREEAVAYFRRVNRGW